MLHQLIFLQGVEKLYILYFLCFYSLYIVKYILLGATIGGYSHSTLYSITASSYFGHILGFISHIVILVLYFNTVQISYLIGSKVTHVTYEYSGEASATISPANFKSSLFTSLETDCSQGR